MHSDGRSQTVANRPFPDIRGTHKIASVTGFGC